MKIGILTHHYINNYGAFLQAWALCDAIQTMCPNDKVEIIDYVNLKHKVINTFGWFRFYKDRENLKCWREKIKLPKTFSRARQKEMKLSRRCYKVEQVNKLEYDVIIIGSDEVWNFKDSKAYDPIKFGIGLKCKKLIAYAPSVGQATFKEMPKCIEEGIKKFSAISARDDLSFELVEKVAGKSAIRVLDPTFLSKFPMKKIEVNKPYILFYYCDKLPKRIKEQILKYAKENQMAVYGAGECDKQYTNITVNLTPFEWVGMFRNARFVFTGTFHGTVFSILNKRQFKVYLTNESRIKKVGALLRELKIENRIMESEFKFDLQKMGNEINYEKVYNIIDKKKKESLQFLEDAIRR